LIIAFISAGVAGFSSPSLGIFKAYFFEPALLFILILNIFQKDYLKKIGLSLAIGAFIVSVYAIFQKITGLGITNPFWADEATRRAVSFFGYPNAVGLYFGPIIPILLAILFIPREHKEPSLFEKKIFFPLKIKQISIIGLSKLFLVLIIICSLLAVIFAQSEGALIGLLAALFIFALLDNKRSRITAIIIAVIAVSSVFAYLPTREYAVKKLTLMDFSGQVRRYQWKETLNMLNDGRFFSGAGLANYQKTIAPYHQDGFFYDDGTDPNFHQHTVESAEYRAKTWHPVEIYLYPHNIILNFWSELGFFGMILFVWILLKAIYQLSIIIYHSKKIKDRKSLFIAIGLLGSIITIIVNGLVDVPYFKNDLSCLFWILVAILSLANLESKDKLK